MTHDLSLHLLRDDAAVRLQRAAKRRIHDTEGRLT